MTTGISFSPLSNANASDPQNPSAGSGFASQPVTDAIRLLSLKMPTTVGPSAVSPLFGSPTALGGAGITDSILQKYLGGVFGQPQAAQMLRQTFPGAPGGLSPTSSLPASVVFQQPPSSGQPPSQIGPPSGPFPPDFAQLLAGLVGGGPITTQGPLLDRSGTTPSAGSPITLSNFSSAPETSYGPPSGGGFRASTPLPMAPQQNSPQDWMSALLSGAGFGNRTL